MADILRDLFAIALILCVNYDCQYHLVGKVTGMYFPEHFSGVFSRIAKGNFPIVPQIKVTIGVLTLPALFKR